MNSNTLVVIFTYLGLVGQLITSTLAGVAAISSGLPASSPQIRTYVGGKHVAIDITVTPLP